MPQTVAELPRKAGGGHVTAVPAPFPVTGDKREDVGLRTRHGAFDDRRKRPREVAATALLPCRDERPGSCVVDDRGPRRREAQPAAGALHAAPHRPRAGTAAPLADGRRDANERRRRTRRTARPPGRRIPRSGSGAPARAGPRLDAMRREVTSSRRLRDDFLPTRGRRRRASRGGPARRARDPRAP